MIPTIEEILEGLLDGTYLLDKAVRLVDQHIEHAGLRVHFAGLAMQGLIAVMYKDVAKKYIDKIDQINPLFAKTAYEVADAMMKER